MRPDCPSFVPGYGDANADFHVVGDHPGVHGGLKAGVPFTGEPWSPAFLSALTEAGLLAGLHEDAGVDGTVPVAETEAALATPDGGRSDDPPIDPIRTNRTYFSYLHMCATDGTPSERSYDDMERFFDAELRAIAAHVLLPVGARATAHVLQQYTARAWKTEIDMDALHAEELLGSGWLVVPIKDPADWVEGDADRLVESLRELRSTDFRRESDLGRFVAGHDPYLVR
ncbi:hypothetical protein C461_02136 [Halorubrum aidingense JCM 13560]|uniref:Uracil-DNA glycosylase-like domain-containing protein n=2 Tax=Halorubrum aidingense TaxID=368623 RepID=M0PID9_9EURY|nr:hypothetical protein C461_02136 [Halorubrum aidingense JCM 13560]